MKTRLIALTMCFALVVSLAGVVTAETTYERALRTGSVTIGFSQEPPYAYMTLDGTLTGEALEVAKAVLTELGITNIEPVITEWASLIPGLNAGRFDMISNGMYITPARCEQVLFASPEHQVSEALAVRTGNPLKLHSFEDIAANPNVRVAIMNGAMAYDLMKAVGVSERQMMLVPDDPSAVEALAAGLVDAWSATAPAMNALLSSGVYRGVERVEDFDIDVGTISYGGTAFRKSDQDFRDAFSRVLDGMKESGQLTEILAPFGFEAPPAHVTVGDICPPQ